MRDERERRRSQRLSAELTVEVRPLGRPKERRTDVVRNISAGGVFIESDVELGLGAPLVLELVLETQPLALEGEVVRVEATHERPSGGRRSMERAKPPTQAPPRMGQPQGRQVTGWAVAFSPGQAALETLRERVERALARSEEGKDTS